MRSFPIYGNSTLGYYYLDAFVGTPPQRRSLIMDTGSHLTIFPCSECTHCRGHLHPIFDTRSSSTFRNVNPDREYFDWRCSRGSETCRFSQGYTEGSVYEGYFAVDRFLFEGEMPEPKVKDAKFDHIFGCATRESGEFYSQEVDGIIGFGVKKIGDRPPSIIDIEQKERRIKGPAFSICMAHDGGVMNFGNWNSKRHIGPQKWLDSSRLSWKEQYMVEVGSIEIGGKKLSYDFEAMNSGGGRAFLDTGTTFVYFSQDLFSEWRSKFADFCGQDAKHCGGTGKARECYEFKDSKYENFEAFLHTFPNVTFTLNQGVPWPWFPQDYLVQSLDSSAHFCVGVKTLKNMILGAVFMKNVDVFFDREASKIGFARAGCGSDPSPWLEDFNPSPKDQPPISQPSKKHKGPLKAKTKTLKTDPITPKEKISEPQESPEEPDLLEDFIHESSLQTLGAKAPHHRKKSSGKTLRLSRSNSKQELYFSVGMLVFAAFVFFGLLVFFLKRVIARRGEKQLNRALSSVNTTS